MNSIVVAVVLYIVVYPIIFRLIPVLHTQLRVKPAMEKAGRSKANMRSIPKPLWRSKWRPRLGFAFKDKRVATFGKKSLGSLQNRQFMFIIWVFGLILMIASSFAPETQLKLIGYLIAFFVFMAAMMFGMNRAKQVVDARNVKISKMFEIGVAKLGLSRDYIDNPGAMIEVQEWRDLIFPQQVKFHIPTTFSSDGEAGFLLQFNQVFGSETTFVAHNTQESGKPGWNYEEGELIIRAVPPLPRKAEWKEKYVLDERIAPSFFPIALGVENGIELIDEETGEKEYVLGFDVSGAQADLAKEKGVNIGGEIVAAPMTLIAGGTGGGKAEDASTKVLRWIED